MKGLQRKGNRDMSPRIYRTHLKKQKQSCFLALFVRKFISISFITKAVAICISSIIFSCSWGICLDDASPSPVPNTMDRTLSFFYWLPIMSDFNSRDAQIAMKVWAEKFGEHTGIFNDGESFAFHNRSEMIQNLRNNKWDIVMLPAEEFFNTEREMGLCPDFTVKRGGLPGDEYVLLVHKGSGIDSLADLKGRKFVTSTKHNYQNILVWLDFLLSDHGLPSTDKFFQKVSGEHKECSVILPVFFRKVDACAVSRVDFELMSELNPQVGCNLKILVSSPRLIPIIFSIAPHIDSISREILLSSFLTVQEDKDFNQILTLHKVEGLAIIDEIALESTRRMYEQHQEREKELFH